MRCRFCQAPLTRTFVDLGRAPLSNAFLTAEQLCEPEPHYPLHAYICDECLLVQLDQFAPPEQIFGDYLYYFILFGRVAATRGCLRRAHDG